MTRLIALVSLLLLPLPAIAHEIQAGEIEIIHPALPLPPAGASSAAIYMALTNHGEEAERLLAVEVPLAASATLHRSQVGDDGVARMLPVEAIEIPPHDTVLLEPGGLHLMLMGLSRPLEEGEHVPATLTFEKGGQVVIEVMVDPRDTGHDHDAHSHAGH